MKYVKFIGSLAYILATICLAISGRAANEILLIILYSPICLWLVLFAHELSHFIFFHLLGFKVKTLMIGQLRFDFQAGSNKFKLTEYGIWRGYCSILEGKVKDKRKLSLALASGGFSGLLLAVISITARIAGTSPQSIRAFLVSLALTGLYSFYFTLLSPKSRDNELIRELKKVDKDGTDI